MKELTVVNHNPSAMTDSYFGVKYVFTPGERVVIPYEAGVHMFGFGLAPESPKMVEVLRRAGFAADNAAGRQFISNFEINQVEYVPVEDAEELNQVKIALEERNGVISEQQARIEALEAENAQLRKKGKKGDD